MPAYRSQISQAIHYLARPHDAPARGPVGGPAAWRADTIVGQDVWREQLTTADVDELERALDHATSSGRTLGALRQLDFPLRALRHKVARWRHTLTRGRGFVVLGGVPVSRWGAERARCFFWCFGLHLGLPGAQNPAGDLLGHVRDTGEAAGDVRLYRTRSRIAYHCDLADVVGLLCLSAARSGGRSTIASSVAVHDELLRRMPEAVPRLYAPFMLDAFGEGGVPFFPVEPCRHHLGRLRTFFHSDYFRSSQRYPAVPRLREEERRLLDTYDQIAGDPAVSLSIDLRPGDVQLLNNHTVIHGRTAYEDGPDAPRHLLRLWLSVERAAGVTERVAKERARARVLASFAAARLRGVVRRR